MILGRRTILAGLAAAFAPVARRAAAAPTAPAAGESCRLHAFAGASFAVCSFDLRRFAVTLHHLGPDGQPFGSVGRLADSPDGRGIVMAMNAGMYHADLRPVGLYVENGREEVRVSRANGPGNFHLKPNGVFFVGRDGKAGVLETEAFLRARTLRPRFATQSGPMLVIDGAIHPRFSDEGESRKVRNGVGVSDGSTVHFAMSQGGVSFGTFARLFRDELGCRNALFLDGSISSLYAPALGRRDISLKPLGPLVAVRPR